MIKKKQRRKNKFWNTIFDSTPVQNNVSNNTVKYFPNYRMK